MPLSPIPMSVVKAMPRFGGPIVGHATVIDRRTLAPVVADVELKSETIDKKTRQPDFRMYRLMKDKLELGFIKLDVKAKSLYVRYMQASERFDYKGIGTALHQIAIECSRLLGKGGNVYFNAQPLAVGFHYKSGFRSPHKATNKKIDDFVKANAQVQPDDLPRFEREVKMSLPEEGLSAWLQRIAKQPILNETKVQQKTTAA